MSRVGKKEIVVPNNVEVTYINNEIVVQGDKGVLSLKINPIVKLILEEGLIRVLLSDNTRFARSIQGLTRSLIVSLIIGVTVGFEKSLEINGIGYKVELENNKLLFNIGYSHPVFFELPEGITAKIERNLLRLFGINKELLGRTASSIRNLRPPEPYKGKGIKYLNEYIKRKAGKTATK